MQLPRNIQGGSGTFLRCVFFLHAKGRPKGQGPASRDPKYALAKTRMSVCCAFDGVSSCVLKAREARFALIVVKEPLYEVETVGSRCCSELSVELS